MRNIFESGFYYAPHKDQGTKGELPVAQQPDAKTLLDKEIATHESAVLGHAQEKADIKSSISPFSVLPEYKTKYPEVVTEALGDLYEEYNRAFGTLVEQNREWDTDYQYSFSPDGTPLNGWVQIDMVGLPAGFLQKAEGLNKEEIREAVRGRIFEIENSLAMYQLLENIFAQDGQETNFKRKFRNSLDHVRQKHQRPIALLAVTDQKYEAMRQSEFGKMEGESLSDNEVRELSGFDKFFGPSAFLENLRDTGGESNYLLYVRSSDPVSKLKKPDTPVENPLLADKQLRKVIKANAITFNIDDPELPPGSISRINDTKAYLPAMNMAYPAFADSDILAPEFLQYLSKGNPYVEYSNGSGRLSSNFATYLESQGIDPARVEAGDVIIRTKPMKGTYGCYGHLIGELGNKKFRQELRQNMNRRGPYVIQPEMQSPVIINETDGRSYTYIDRNFLAFTNGKPEFLGGFRSLMPTEANEAIKGRNHGSRSTVWAEIK